jgi:hypothetical protein
MGVAYGLSIFGPGLGPGLLDDADERFPAVVVDHRSDPMPDEHEMLDDRRAKLRFSDGVRWATMERAPARATYWGPAPPPDELLHPFLGAVGSVFARWHRREAFHGGALVIKGAAWALLGRSDAGKSSLLAAHAARGGAVLSDDVVVADGRRAFAGPRCIDLRAPLPDGLGRRLDMSDARGGTRRRVRLGDLDACVPLGGWVFIDWGDELELTRLPAQVALSRLAGWRSLKQIESDPAVMLDLAGLPAFDLRRPRSWDALMPTLDALIEAVSV